MFTKEEKIVPDTWKVLTCTFPGSIQYKFCSYKHITMESVVNDPEISQKQRIRVFRGCEAFTGNSMMRTSGLLRDAKQ